MLQRASLDPPQACSLEVQVPQQANSFVILFFRVVFLETSDECAARQQGHSTEADAVGMEWPD